MSAWTEDELGRIGRATEIEISSRRPDGSLRPFVTIWAVPSGDAIYVRSAYGWNNGWFQRALKAGRGQSEAGDWNAMLCSFNRRLTRQTP